MHGILGMSLLDYFPLCYCVVGKNSPTIIQAVHDSRTTQREVGKEETTHHQKKRTCHTSKDSLKREQQQTTRR
jgi:hypothetical protein